MKYDIASKRFVELSGPSLLRTFVDMEIGDFELIEELPQQTVSLRSSDFALRVRDRNGNVKIVLLEFLSWWEVGLPLRVGEYLIRYEQKYRLPVVPVVFLFRPDRRVTDRYESTYLRVNYHLVRVWEMEGSALLKRGDLWLLPLVAAAKSGRSEILEAERQIYEGDLDRGVKADLLAILTIFAGFKDRTFVEELLRRRRDIMIESVAYEIIKEEGIAEGLERGIVEGMEKGALQAFNGMVVDVLEERFNIVPVRLAEKIAGVKNAAVLKGLLRQAIRCESLEMFEQILEKAR